MVMRRTNLLMYMIAINAKNMRYKQFEIGNNKLISKANTKQIFILYTYLNIPPHLLHHDTSNEVCVRDKRIIHIVSIRSKNWCVKSVLFNGNARNEKKRPPIHVLFTEDQKLQ